MTEARRLLESALVEMTYSALALCDAERGQILSQGNPDSPSMLMALEIIENRKRYLSERTSAAIIRANEIPSREGELVAALEKFRLGESDHFFGCGVFHRLDRECTLACASARAALAQGKKE